jgi:hypothetical protein
MGSLSDHCHTIEVDYQSGSEQPHSKGCRHFNWLTVFNFNLRMLRSFEGEEDGSRQL